MSWLSSLKMKSKILILTGSVFGRPYRLYHVSYFVQQTVSINGPLYNEIVNNKDLVVDILPPPEYILEAYLVVKQIKEKRKMNRVGRILSIGYRLLKAILRHDMNSGKNALPKGP